MTSFVTWLLAFGLFLLFFIALWVFLRAKPVLNKVLEIASKELSDSVESMLKTPSDIPDEVLKWLQIMSESAFAPGVTRTLAFGFIKRKGKSSRFDKSHEPAHVALEKAFEQMRPELKELFLKATSAWVKIICHRSLVTGPFIAFAFSRSIARRGKIDTSGANSNFDLIDSFDRSVSC